MILDYNYKMRYCSNHHTLTLFIRPDVTLLPLMYLPVAHTFPSPSPSPSPDSLVSASSDPNILHSEIYAFAVLNGGLDWRVTVAHVSIYRRGRGIYILSRCLRRM